MKPTKLNVDTYEQLYQNGYGAVFPESHVIRVHRHILDWELDAKPGPFLDFGCGIGTHACYFARHGYTPFGCDTSSKAIEQAKQLLPEHAANFHVTHVIPKLETLFAGVEFNLCLANQVLYFLSDTAIRNIVQQIHALLRPGGVFLATMMSYSCWYNRLIVAKEGDFHRVEFNDVPRQQPPVLINFKSRDELFELFAPFKKLHLGSYSNHVREEEGPTDHWLFVGVRL